MWIMLIRKLPTAYSPPKMSLFWSTAWPNDKHAQRQAQTCCPEFQGYTEEDSHIVITHDGVLPAFLDANWIGARQIVYKGEPIRVFPHEFNIVSDENMLIFTAGDGARDPPHELIVDDVASERIVDAALDNDGKLIYDAALVDGCTPEQAKLVALGMDITMPSATVPPVGWYRIKREYGEYFCDDWELTEQAIRENYTEVATNNGKLKRRSGYDETQQRQSPVKHL